MIEELKPRQQQAYVRGKMQVEIYNLDLYKMFRHIH